jgi:hypothetical protein
MKFKSHYEVAETLQADDWFKMGGALYRITDVNTVDLVTHINFRNVENRPISQHSMSVPHWISLKIYNQK